MHDALAGVSRLGFDTSSFIYFMERHPSYVAVLFHIFREVDAGRIQGFGSAVTLTELLTKPMQQGDTVLQREDRALLLQSRHFSLVPIDAAIAEQAAALRARYHVRTPDALQLAAALAAHCEAFLTNDAALRRVAELRVLLVDQLVV